VDRSPIVLPANGGYVIAQSLPGIYAIILLASFGWWREIGLKRVPNWSECLPFLPLLIAPLLILISSGIHLIDPIQIGLALLFTLAIGFPRKSHFEASCCVYFCHKVR
jgi:hypothetical protein